MSSKINKFLIDTGYQKLNLTTTLYQSIFKSQSENLIDLYEKRLQNFSENDYFSLLKFIEFDYELAMSLILFYSHDEIKEKYKHLPFMKQFQIGMRHFCLLKRPWSRRDTKIAQEASKKLPNPIYPDSLSDELKPYYKIWHDLWRKHGSVQWMKPYDEILPRNKQLNIWFLKDTLLENLYFGLYGELYGIGRMECCQIPNTRNVSDTVADALRQFSIEDIKNLRVTKLVFPSLR